MKKSNYRLNKKLVKKLKGKTKQNESNKDSLLLPLLFVRDQGKSSSEDYDTSNQVKPKDASDKELLRLPNLREIIRGEETNSLSRDESLDEETLQDKTNKCQTYKP